MLLTFEAEEEKELLPLTQRPNKKIVAAHMDEEYVTLQVRW